ncbi:hypothetical protein M406DRAFT_88917 [Cryphonectria parasitica EP155]|uniref:Rab-GAP TBC domain-containing protein n=1 Tax=Cryphonectria parasitica (strain ATCC 38755 / EP155) TaxID=660469 RepID=A0A9P4Y442_CRYP1|nr:uncharacterized protein M406DRAFT_88917 [Cryphonectria parasitica EP155]KAF3766109.1 hypothetical protein M406DRAFT_88917 [Cryphonectria parasitica EP155]
MYLSPSSPLSVTSLPSPRGSAHRHEFELAGGIEDWEDVRGADVDRYGFIQPGSRRPISRASSAQAIKAAQDREARRTEKWRNMAKMIEGVQVEFDTRSPKLIERTWKGIPDRWRSSAWYSFLASSARDAKSEVTDQELIAQFHSLQEVSSSDDVQIDLDVPRTINRHIMFRKRYRGGQRLLFRVLHALSLYFPDTGYVQGMAALAASLLCYYDEERCFVMLVWLWQFRGLKRLYQHGFGGLMIALQDLEKYWLKGKPISQKLNDLGIDPTAYGTRWYLTLFNLSIPFPVQLRVWDVFILLGGCPPTLEPSSGKAKQKEQANEPESDMIFDGLDIIHATAAALIDIHRDVIIDGDFENVMKGLTSFQEVKDEDKFINLVRAEWNTHRGKKKG